MSNFKIFFRYIQIFIYFCLSLFFLGVVVSSILKTVGYSWNGLWFTISDGMLLFSLIFENLISSILGILFILMGLNKIKNK